MIDFSTLKGLTIPEGVVTQITDASGRVLWSAKPKMEFRTIVDFGELTTATTPSANGFYQNTLILSVVPSNYEATHVMINGEIYEVTHTISTNMFTSHIYKPVTECVLADITLGVLGQVLFSGNFKEPGTYTVQIGQMVPGSVKLSSIAVTTPPTKATYSEGEVFDPAGMVVTATYSDGFTMPVTNYTIIGGDQISEANPTVTISYTEGGVTATTAYEVGFAPSGATVTIEAAGTWNKDARVTINGNDYRERDEGITVLTVPIGTEIVCNAYCSGSSGGVWVNGTKVAPSGSAYGTQTYTYVANGDIYIYMTSSDSYSRINITEQ